MQIATAAFLMSLAAGTVHAMKIGDLAQGSEFTKCIKITDFNRKSLGDEVEVTDKGSDGCCPEGYIPGIQWFNNYWGAMIVCGFKDDGSVNMAMSSSNDVKSCEYNKCYVVKMDITCADNSKMKLDGCCRDDADLDASGNGKHTTKWPEDCKMYSKSQSFFKEKVGYCTSYAKKYKLEGTNEKTDDQAGGKLSLTTIKAYTGCAPFGGSLGGSTGGTTGTSPSPSPSTATGSTGGYWLVGDGACQDASGSHGSFSKSTDKGDACRTNCNADSTCTGYDNRAAGCVYYKISITKSNAVSTAYKCYRKGGGTTGTTGTVNNGCNDFDGTTKCESFETGFAMQASVGVLGLIGALVGILM